MNRTVKELAMGDTAKTAIITGASRGIGAGLVEAFLKRGYNLVANSRNITKENPFAGAANIALVDGDIGHDCGYRRIAIWPDRCTDKQCGCFYSETLHRVHDRRLQHFSLHDACWLSLRVTANHKANVAAEVGQHHQRVHYPG